MKRLLLAIVATAAFAVAGAFAAPAQADTATRLSQSGGGGFTNPCNGDLVTFSVDLTGELVSSQGTFLVELEGGGPGTGFDLVTGETYNVTFEFSGAFAQDGSGSFTGHSEIVFVGQQGTFVIHSVANVNFRPSEPVIIEIANATCAGIGKRSF